MAKQNQSNNTENGGILDLGNILGNEVKVDAQPQFTPIESESYTEPELDPEPEPAVIIENTQTGYSGEEPKKLSPDDIAIIGVNLLDGIQRFAFAFARKKYLFTDEELEIIAKTDHSGKVIYPPGSKEAISHDKYVKHLEIIKTLPFEEGEKQRLTDATIIYARTMDLKVSPLQGLLLAYGEVLGTRAITVFND